MKNEFTIFNENYSLTFRAQILKPNFTEEFIRSNCNIRILIFKNHIHFLESTFFRRVIITIFSLQLISVEK